MFGKEENISNFEIEEKDVVKLLSGKTFTDENFPVASFVIKKIFKSTSERSIFLLEQLMTLLITVPFSLKKK